MSISAFNPLKSSAPFKIIIEKISKQEDSTVQKTTSVAQLSLKPPEENRQLNGPEFQDNQIIQIEPVSANQQKSIQGELNDLIKNLKDKQDPRIKDIKIKSQLAKNTGDSSGYDIKEHTDPRYSGQVAYKIDCTYTIQCLDENKNMIDIQPPLQSLTRTIYIRAPNKEAALETAMEAKAYFAALALKKHGYIHHQIKLKDDLTPEAWNYASVKSIYNTDKQTGVQTVKLRLEDRDQVPIDVTIESFSKGERSFLVHFDKDLSKITFSKFNQEEFLEKTIADSNWVVYTREQKIQLIRNRILKDCLQKEGFKPLETLIKQSETQIVNHIEKVAAEIKKLKKELEYLRDKWEAKDSLEELAQMVNDNRYLRKEGSVQGFSLEAQTYVELENDPNKLEEFRIAKQKLIDKRQNANADIYDSIRVNEIQKTFEVKEYYLNQLQKDLNSSVGTKFYQKDPTGYDESKKELHKLQTNLKEAREISHHLKNNIDTKFKNILNTF